MDPGLPRGLGVQVNLRLCHQQDNRQGVPVNLELCHRQDPAGRPGGPGAGPAGPPREMRLELRIATDEAGEIYILTKADGFIRRVTSIK